MRRPHHGKRPGVAFRPGGWRRWLGRAMAGAKTGGPESGETETPGHAAGGKAPIWRRLARNQQGLALTEMAFVAPFFLTTGLLGLDTANFVITHMRVSQLAMHVADNASRVGEQNTLLVRRVYEGDINDLFLGAQTFSSALDLATHGRVILSSLEVNGDGGQWIRWQRCYGAKIHPSSFGQAGQGSRGTSLPGMGAPGALIRATPGNAVMFAEVAYEYQSIGPISVMDGETITYTGAFHVRDTRDLTQIYQTNPPAPIASCGS